MRLSRRDLAVGVLGYSMFLMNCREDSRPTGPESPQPQMQDVSFSKPAPGKIRTMDDEFADLAEAIPGFAGFYYGEDGRLVVRLVSVADSSTAGERLAPYLLQRRVWNRAGREGRRQATASDLRYLSATYDFSTLKEWYDQLQP